MIEGDDDDDDGAGDEYFCSWLVRLLAEVDEADFKLCSVWLLLNAEFVVAVDDDPGRSCLLLLALDDELAVGLSASLKL